MDVDFYSQTTLMLCLDGGEGDVGGLMNLILEFFFFFFFKWKGGGFEGIRRIRYPLNLSFLIPLGEFGRGIVPLILKKI